MASDGHKAALWSVGLLRLSQDRCPFRSSGKLGLGPRGPLKGPVHSFLPAAFQPCHSLSPGGPAGPCQSVEACPSRVPIAGRKESLASGTPPGLLIPPSWRETQVVFRGIFGVGHGEATSSGLRLQSPLQQAEFQPRLLEKTSSNRQEANVTDHVQQLAQQFAKEPDKWHSRKAT